MKIKKIGDFCIINIGKSHEDTFHWRIFSLESDRIVLSIIAK